MHPRNESISVAPSRDEHRPQDERADHAEEQHPVLQRGRYRERAPRTTANTKMLSTANAFSMR